MPEEDSRSPNDQLSELIASKLVDEELIPSDREEEVLAGLKAGTLNNRDWRLLLEIAVEEGEEEHNGSAH